MTTPGRSERTGVNPRHEDVITSILLGGDQYEPYSIVFSVDHDPWSLGLDNGERQKQ